MACPEASVRWYRAGAVDAVRPSAPLEVEVAGRLVCLYRIGDRIYATAGLCTHAPSRLCEGFVDGEIIECDRHLGAFHIPTGRAVKAPCVVDLETYPVRVDGDEVWVAIPAREAGRSDDGTGDTVGARERAGEQPAGS